MEEKRDEEKKDLQRVGEQPPAPLPEKSLQVGQVQLDLTGLTEQQIQELKMKHLELTIETANRAARIVTDVKGLNAALDTMAHHTKDIAESGEAITITKTHNDDLGRTEVIMGTSDAAKSGKLSRSQIGLKGNPNVWIIVAAIIGAAIVIAALLK